MLRELHIRDFALIEDLSLTFEPGLNILTGETGAGKSIIIDALGFVLGDRVSPSDILRTGAVRASVDAVFNSEPLTPSGSDPIWERLREAGLDGDGDDGALFLSREVSGASGKSQCRINGRLVPAGVLREMAEGLVDVHGQHEHQSLLASDRHVDILDAWCGKEAFALRSDIAGAVGRLGKLRRDLEQLRSDARERVRMIDLYRFQAEEIVGAGLSAAEEESLLAEHSRLANAGKLSAASGEAHDYLSGAEHSRGAVDLLNAALTAVEHALSMDDTLLAIALPLREAVAYAEDASRELRRYQDGVEFNPERLEEIDNRLEALKTLKRKYGDTIEDILAYLEDIDGKLVALEHSEAREAELETEISKVEQEVSGIAARLTERRRSAADAFAASITRELKDLGMSAAKFEASLTPQPVTAKGAERVEFLISPNPGEPLKPLARIASGGEMSRVMLAIKSVMAGTAGIPTMIFDEIDVGVGGRTANVLGDKLAALGANAQVLCITHLPQIAAKAAAHFLIEKRVAAGRTSVHVARLSPDERVHEIVRMLGGSSGADAVLQHAREMLSVAG